MSRKVMCAKLGQELDGLDRPPYPGDLGARIFREVSAEAWDQWKRLQTMLINENRLNLAEPAHRSYLMEQCERHFFGQGADEVAGYVPPNQN